MILLSALMFAVAGALGIATNKSDDIFGVFDPRRATQGRAGINSASWNLCRTALAQRRDLMLSGEHE
jgi:hypothetical protein